MPQGLTGKRLYSDDQAAIGLLFSNRLLRMTFDYLSDVHLDFFNRFTMPYLGKSFARYWSDVFRSRRGETLLIAGDVFSHQASLEKVWRFFELAADRWQNVYCVLGNHDYWSLDTPFDEILAETQDLYPSVKFLENEFVDIGGLKLFGATWWTQICPADDRAVRARMVDYRWTVSSEKEAFCPALTSRLHRESKEILAADIESHPGTPYLVLTHHTPSRKSSTWPENTLTQAFCNDDDRFVFDHPGIRVWVHGHVHESCDYKLGQTRVLCNPHGYIGTERRIEDRFRLKHFDLF